jgi:hypothetical protein
VPPLGSSQTAELHDKGTPVARGSLAHNSRASLVPFAVAFAALALGCTIPQTNVVLDNDYPAAQAAPLVAYAAIWQAVIFPSPVAPGSSSAPQSTVPASANTAYVVLAPGWDPTSPTKPTSFVVLQSRSGFAVDLGDTLHIPVDDTTFAGNCAAGSLLTQAQADFITQYVFPSTFAGFHYDAATCTTTQTGDAGAP